MKSKIHISALLLTTLLVGGLLIFSFNRPAQAGGPFDPTPVGIYGYVTYSNPDCQHTNHDTVWVYNSNYQKVKYALVTTYRSSYIYIVFLDEDPGTFHVIGNQSLTGCYTDEYEVYFDGDVRLDIDFNIAPVK